MKLPDLYKEVTERIVAQLSAGTIPWAKTYDQATASALVGLPFNAKTGRQYNGINILQLWNTADAKGYPSQGWLTFNQATELGAHVRKGEKSTPAIFTKMVDAEEEQGGQTTLVKKPMLRVHYVFNAAQIEGLPDSFTTPSQLEPVETRYNNVLAFANRTGVPIIYGSSKPYYTPSRDEVHMPPYGSFVNDEAFCGTLCHELTHATGHEKRLARSFGRRFGDKAYAFEELVAEMGSAFLCARHGVEPTTRSSAAYLQSWLQVLKADNTAIFHAASQASKASNFLLNAAELQIEPEAEELTI